MSRSWLVALLTALALLAPSPARAQEQDQGEVRIYLDGDANVLQGVEGTGGITLRPMVRTEQRFRVEGLYLLKVFVGLRTDLLPWLRLQSYYAHKDKWSSGVHHQIHMAVLDVILHHRWGPVALAWRLGNEYHSEGFYRMRNYFDLHLALGVSWLKLYLSEEFRFDSDQVRINMNDIRAGLDFIVNPWLKLRTFYDLELNHRSRDDWHRSHVAGPMLILRPGAGGSIHEDAGHHGL